MDLEGTVVITLKLLSGNLPVQKEERVKMTANQQKFERTTLPVPSPLLLVSTTQSIYSVFQNGNIKRCM
jgi:hypothetical protein